MLYDHIIGNETADPIISQLVSVVRPHPSIYHPHPTSHPAHFHLSSASYYSHPTQWWLCCSSTIAEINKALCCWNHVIITNLFLFFDLAVEKLQRLKCKSPEPDSWVYWRVRSCGPRKVRVTEGTGWDSWVYWVYWRTRRGGGGG